MFRAGPVLSAPVNLLLIYLTQDPAGPIAHSHYKDFLDLRGGGRIVLYKRADTRTLKWTARLRIPTVSGFVVRSTKTIDDVSMRRALGNLLTEQKNDG
jgi:hypothetical protein